MWLEQSEPVAFKFKFRKRNSRHARRVPDDPVLDTAATVCKQSRRKTNGHLLRSCSHGRPYCAHWNDPQILAELGERLRKKEIRIGSGQGSRGEIAKGQEGFDKRGREEDEQEKVNLAERFFRELSACQPRDSGAHDDGLQWSKQPPRFRAAIRRRCRFSVIYCRFILAIPGSGAERGALSL
jgi:hypothetical protein